MIKCVILVTGSRKNVPKEFVYEHLDKYLQQYKFHELILIHGDALGVDSYSGMWTDDNGVFEIKIPAKWAKYNKKAGSIRNGLMIFIAKLFIPKSIKVVVEAFPIPESIGTFNCIDQAKESKIETNIHLYK